MSAIAEPRWCSSDAKSQSIWLLIVSVQDIVNSFERTFYLDEDSGHREQYQAV